MYHNRWLRFAQWATGQGIYPLDPTASQIAIFLYYLFDTHGLKLSKDTGPAQPQVLSCTGNAAAVQAKTISDMITYFYGLTKA